MDRPGIEPGTTRSLGEIQNFVFRVPTEHSFVPCLNQDTTEPSAHIILENSLF